MIEKWNIKTVGAKGRQIFFSGNVKENKVGTKERQIFFSGRAKQNKVGGKEWLGCLAFALTLKQDNRVTLSFNFILFRSTARKDLSLFCSNFIFFHFTAEEDLSSFCSNRLYVSLFYHNNIYFPLTLSASHNVYILYIYTYK